MFEKYFCGMFKKYFCWMFDKYFCGMFKKYFCGMFIVQAIFLEEEVSPAPRKLPPAGGEMLPTIHMSSLFAILKKWIWDPLLSKGKSPPLLIVRCYVLRQQLDL